MIWLENGYLAVSNKQTGMSADPHYSPLQSIHYSLQDKHSMMKDSIFNFLLVFSQDHVIELSLQVQPILFQFVAENCHSTQILTIF